MMPSYDCPRRRTAMICVHEQTLLVCRFRDPHTRDEFYVVPGGKIEAAESARDCAEREVREETGYLVQVLDEAVTTTRYPFEWNGHVVQCETTWFIGRLADPSRPPEPVADADFNLRTAWLPLADIETAFDYHDHIRAMVLELVARATGRDNG